MLNVHDSYVDACVAMTKLRLATCPSRYLLEYEDLKMLVQESLDCCEHFAMNAPHAALATYDHVVQDAVILLKRSYDKELKVIKEEEIPW